MDTYYLQVVNKKLDIAQKLYNGEIGGTYYEAMLIISSILSATARILWPTDSEYKRIDFKRFVELIIQYNTTDYNFHEYSLSPMVSSHPMTNSPSFFSYNNNK